MTLSSRLLRLLVERFLQLTPPGRTHSLDSQYPPCSNSSQLCWVSWNGRFLKIQFRLQRKAVMLRIVNWLHVYSVHPGNGSGTLNHCGFVPLVAELFWWTLDFSGSLTWMSLAWVMCLLFEHLAFCSVICALDVPLCFICRYNTVDMCVAVATDSGLITPIVFQADKKVSFNCFLASDGYLLLAPVTSKSEAVIFRHIKLLVQSACILIHIVFAYCWLTRHSDNPPPTCCHPHGIM